MRIGLAGGEALATPPVHPARARTKEERGATPRTAVLARVRALDREAEAVRVLAGAVAKATRSGDDEPTR